MSMIVCAIGLTTYAQTNFRPISFDEAMRAAKQENKMIFVDFYTDWCGPCKKMANEVFPQKHIGDFFNARFVCVKFNAEKEGADLAKRFEVKAYPTFLVLNTDGEVHLMLKGAMDGDDFMARISAGLNPDMTPARMTERYNRGERTPELVNAYAMNKMEQGKEAEGFQIVNDYFASLTDVQRLAASNVFLYTRYTLELNDEKAKFMIAHRNDFEESVRGDIMGRIKQLYHAALVGYFSGYLFCENRYEEENYIALKKDMQDLGLNANGTYTPMFRLIECRAANDDAAFLLMCEKEFGSLGKQACDLLIMNMTRLIRTEDKEILKGMSRFIRSHLECLSPSAITLSGRILGDIELKLNEKQM